MGVVARGDSFRELMLDLNALTATINELNKMGPTRHVSSEQAAQWLWCSTGAARDLVDRGAFARG